MQILVRMTQTAADRFDAQISADYLKADEQQNNFGTINGQTAVQASSINTEATTGRGKKQSTPTLIDMISAVGRIIFRPPDPPTILKGPLGQVKKAVRSEPYSLTEIKKIAKYNQATINDVLMAIASGAFRRYMDLHNDDRGHDIRAFILVNLRGLTFDEDLGNKFGLVFLTLPLDHRQPLERLDGVKNGMDRLKASAEYAATYAILNVLGQLPEWVEHLATRFLDTKGTIVSTNVPGSPHQLYLADAPIESIIAWVPQTGRIGVGLSFISYNGQIVVGLNVDAGLMPDPEKFLMFFNEEYKSFQAIVSAAILE
jgi:WS/DGAT/MGAT family acyltransferase